MVWLLTAVSPAAEVTVAVKTMGPVIGVVGAVAASRNDVAPVPEQVTTVPEGAHDQPDPVAGVTLSVPEARLNATVLTPAPAPGKAVTNGVSQVSETGSTTAGGATGGTTGGTTGVGAGGSTGAGVGSGRAGPAEMGRSTPGGTPPEMEVTPLLAGEAATGAGLGVGATGNPVVAGSGDTFEVVPEPLEGLRVPSAPPEPDAAPLAFPPDPATPALTCPPPPSADSPPRAAT